jgi:PAS domain S-box-containing protein
VPHPENGSPRSRPATAGRTVGVLGEALVDALREAADGGFVTDPEGRIILWNAAAEAILGYAPAEVLGRPCCHLFRGEDINDNAICNPDCAIGESAKRGIAVPTFDMRTRSKAGLTVWINVSVLSIRDGRDGAPFIVHLFHDVTFNNEQVVFAHEGLVAAARAGAAPKNGAGVLTRREREVLGLMGTGLNTTAMAERLHVSRATVRNHVQNILLKLDVHSRLEAVAHGLRRRLL